MANEFYRASSSPTSGSSSSSISNNVVLGMPNPMAALGNPLKGLMGGARWAPLPLPQAVPSSLEWYTLGLDEVMVGDNAFNWTSLDTMLDGCASRNMHAILSVYIHWPGQPPLRLPPHPKDLSVYDATNSTEKSLSYGDPRLLKALQQYIVALGGKYDGDTRIAAIHVGLLGYWGEGHCYPDSHLVPHEASSQVAAWYREAFTRTQIQARYAGPNAVGMGLYDGSLFYSSLDGEPNGGGDALCWFTWPQTVAAGQQEAYKTHLIGGETRPELQDSLFTESYPARTPFHQPFDETVDTMHVSYILHHHAFINGGYTGTMLETARRAHAHVGYAFVVDSVVATVTESSTANGNNNNDNALVDLHVTIVQAGIAPFYYDLSLVLKSDDGVLAPLLLPGVNELVDKGQSKTFVFCNLAANQVCLRPLSLQLQSSYAYKDRPILWAQGTNGTISLTLPQVPQTCAAPSSPSSDKTGGFTLATLLECPLCTIL